MEKNLQFTILSPPILDVVEIRRSSSLLTKTKEYNDMLKVELAEGRIKPDLPEFWSFHDCWRFADAAAYTKENMVRDAVNHSPWIDEMKNFRLTAEGAETLAKGVLTVYGRDKNGYPVIWVDYKKADTSTAGCEATKNA